MDIGYVLFLQLFLKLFDYNFDLTKSRNVCKILFCWPNLPVKTLLKQVSGIDFLLKILLNYIPLFNFAFGEMGEFRNFERILKLKGYI